MKFWISRVFDLLIESNTEILPDEWIIQKIGKDNWTKVSPFIEEVKGLLETWRSRENKSFKLVNLCLIGWISIFCNSEITKIQLINLIKEWFSINPIEWNKDWNKKDYSDMHSIIQSKIVDIKLKNTTLDLTNSFVKWDFLDKSSEGFIYCSPDEKIWVHKILDHKDAFKKTNGDRLSRWCVTAENKHFYLNYKANGVEFYTIVDLRKPLSDYKSYCLLAVYNPGLSDKECEWAYADNRPFNKLEDFYKTYPMLKSISDKLTYKELSEEEIAKIKKDRDIEQLLEEHSYIILYDLKTKENYYEEAEQNSIFNMLPEQLYNVIEQEIKIIQSAVDILRFKDITYNGTNLLNFYINKAPDMCIDSFVRLPEVIQNSWIKARNEAGLPEYPKYTEAWLYYDNKITSDHQKWIDVRDSNLNYSEIDERLCNGYKSSLKNKTERFDKSNNKYGDFTLQLPYDNSYTLSKCPNYLNLLLSGRLFIKNYFHLLTIEQQETYLINLLNSGIIIDLKSREDGTGISLDNDLTAVDTFYEFDINTMPKLIEKIISEKIPISHILYDSLMQDTKTLYDTLEI